MVADLVDQTKNISGVIRAFSEVLKTKPNSILDIIGDGKDKKMLSELVKEANITDSVNFIGRTSRRRCFGILYASGLCYCK